MQSDYCTYDHLNISPADQTPELILMFLIGTLQEYIPVLDSKREIEGISGHSEDKRP
jgi:hypothetical protein